MAEKMNVSELEQQKAKELKALQDDWKKLISTKPKIKFPDDGKKYSPECYFAYDGFFPGYFSQKGKVLFVGRETRWIGGGNFDFRETTKEYFRDVNVTGSAWWRTILYVLYGIQHEGQISYADVPVADEIAKEMVRTNNFGFAVMQLSKYSNDSEDGGTRNVYLMNRFLKDSELEKRNFFQEELALLDPDVIITANLWECGVDSDALELCFPEENFSNMKSYRHIVEHGDYNLNGKTVKFINTFHFSARKSTENDFYKPVMKILFGKK